MSAHIIDGRAVSAAILEEVRAEVSRMQSEKGVVPGLVTILVGHNPASVSYVTRKIKTAVDLGFKEVQENVDPNVSETDLLALVDRYNADPTIHGILVQLPLPDHIDPETVIERISPAKDVDGFHPYNVGRLVARVPRLRPCTPWGVIQLLRHIEEPFKGRTACVIGASNIVGRPMALELLLAGATTVICHRFTLDTRTHVRDADIVIAAAGKPGLVRGDWIKPGATVIDIGINRLEDGTLAGDVEFAAAAERAAWITPVPGGVGPMTVAMLLENTLKARQFGANEPSH